MVGSCTVVEFPSGRPLARKLPATRRTRSVAEIARRLSGHQSAPSAKGPDQHLPIRLSDFAGVADSTVRQLSTLALDGVITPASACRLALRHAEEVDRPSSTPPRIVRGTFRYELALAGDPFGEFAFHMRGRGGWIVFAPVTSLGLLIEICPPMGTQVCMLVGQRADRRTTVRLLTAKDWRRLAVAFSKGRDRSGTHHVLLLGGLPSREPDRSSALAQIEQALRRGGNTELVLSTLKKHCEADSSLAAQDPSREMLAMIELAFPGLVDVLAPTKREGE
ncbi:MAG: hypothetical protein K2X54_23440 [Methylobacterium organophilum]|nr:hypothetical protein [Methylobacterium organophilum]